jgi:hypothetical protein
MGGRLETTALNRMLRSLLVEAAQVAVQHDPGLRKQYLHRCHQKPKGAKTMAVPSRGSETKSFGNFRVEGQHW